MIVGFERPDTCDVVYLSEEDLLKEGIVIEQSLNDANTPIKTLKELHYNAVVHDLEGLGKFAKVILMSLRSHKRFKSKEVKDKLKYMLAHNEIDETTISNKLFEKIK